MVGRQGGVSLRRVSIEEQVAHQRTHAHTDAHAHAPSLGKGLKKIKYLVIIKRERN